MDWFIKLVYMKSSIGSFDAKTHLSEYLERVVQGESFLISRRGKAIAELRPISKRGESLKDALSGCAEVRNRLAEAQGSFSVRQMVREDRER